jgi:hypothetical protein
MVPIARGVSLPYESPGNYTGTVDALTGSLAIVAFFVMGTPVVLAFSASSHRRPRLPPFPDLRPRCRM